jgi:hypothetical protein
MTLPPMATPRPRVCTPAVWPAIPDGLDFISLDFYDPSTREAAGNKHLYDKYFIPLLRPHQRLWVGAKDILHTHSCLSLIMAIFPQSS